MSLTLAVEKRTNKTEEVRDAGKIPAILYGPEIEPVSIEVAQNVFEKLYSEAGMSTMIDISVSGADPIKVLVQDVQYDPVKSTITHADFRQIKMGEEMNATTTLEFEGIAPAVKELGGTLTKTLREVNIRCLPKDLVSSIIVNLEVLKTFEDSISIADLKLPEGVAVTDEETTLIAKVTAPLTEEQLKAMEEAETASVEDVEVEGEKKEGEEGAEGEAEKKDEPKAEEKKEESK